MMNTAQKIEELRNKQEHIEFEIGRLAAKVMPEFAFYHKIGVWECTDSPIGLCVYNFIEDSVMDSCIFCGQPHERK